MAIISYRDLNSLKKKHSRKKLIFCSGSFDLIHAGHIFFLEACKNLGDVLVVAVGPDKDIRKNKGGGRPVISERLRLKTVDSLKPVDYSFISKSPRPNSHWLSPVGEILKRLKPDIWVVNYDGGGMDYRKTLASANNIPLVVIRLSRGKSSRYGKISTTAIIEKIRRFK